MNENMPACLRSFTKDDVHTGLKAADKYEAIRMAGDFLVKRGSIEPEYIDAMLQREEVNTTYIGEGVAIPHGVGPSRVYIKESGLAVLQFPDGVPFEDEKAYLVIGIAGKDDEHLPVLQALTDIMLEDGKLDAMIASTDPEFIYNSLTAAE